jgi:hypothetical protein
MLLMPQVSAESKVVPEPTKGSNSKWDSAASITHRTQSAKNPADYLNQP